MKVVVAGGFLGLTSLEQASLQPSPEAVLVEELLSMGEDVRGVGLKQWRQLFARHDDIVHVHHMSKMAVVAVLLKGRVVFTHHSGVYASRGLRKVAEYIVWRCARQVVCLSQAEEAEKVRLFPFLVGRTSVIPNGIRPAIVGSVPHTWNSGSEFIIAQVGQLIELKRVGLGIRALAQLPEHFVLELTYHNDSLLSELQALAEELGVRERVRFLGPCYGDELGARYSRAHILLLTSRTESLPSVVSEALIAGLPVVATAVGGVEEQVGSGGICVQLCSSEYVQAIQDVAGDYPRFAALALERGADLLELSPRAMARAHLALYRRLVEG